MKSLLKSIYHHLPFKKQLFSVIRPLHLPENIYRHLHFKGVIHVKVDEHSSFKTMHYGYQVENEIFWSGLTGNWEKESLKLWITLCRHSKCILDIGANTGIYSLIARAINGNNTIVAIEPVSRVFKKLKHNMELNKYNVLCLDVAASDKDGEAIIYDTDDEHTYSVTVNEDRSLPGVVTKPVTIKTARLDTLIEKHQIPKVDLMKIDVETHEPQVLEGYKKYLKEHQPTMLIEILNDEVAQKVENILNECTSGYLYFNIDERGGIRKTEHLSRSDYFNFLICKKPVADMLKLPMA